MKCISMQIQKKTSLNINTTTHSTISVNGRNVTMIIYNNFTTLSSHKTFTYLGVEYIATTFNVNTSKVINVITIYKPSTLTLSNFLIHFQQFLDVMPTSCSMVIIGDFNIDMLDQNSTQPNKLQFFMDHYFTKFSFKKSQ
jgi:hypothetical protein